MSIGHQFRQLVKARLPRWLMIYKLRGSSSEVLLTFDDGPDPDITPRILDILKEKNKKALFFVVGQKAEKHPDLIRRMRQEGHVVGNHTYSHPHDRVTSISEYKRDIEEAQLVLYKILGERPVTFRPPCGEFSFKTVYSAKCAGLKIVLMSNGGGEWNENASAEPEMVESKIIKNIEPGQIIVMHDNNKKIPLMLGGLIDKIDALGLYVSEVVPVNQL
jgi:peptidoglycan/xylan/chitin deacetylase (PgdA/CDA1 family)